MSRDGPAGISTANGVSAAVRVDWRTSLSLVGTVLKFLSVPLLLPVLVGAAYREAATVVFLVTIGLTLGAGLALERLEPEPDLGAREAFLMVAVTWLAVAVVSAIPYLLAAHGVPGIGPTAPESTLANPANALFEAMSGVTTTGATVLGDISFETHSRATLMWRQLTQWLGGMGIVVLMVAILPELSVGGAQLMDAEAPGPSIEKLTPRIAETARALWLAYIGFTLLEIALLYGLHLTGAAPNMDAYNAVAHGLTTLPTGGFSPEARSIEAFSAVVQWVIIPFMFVAGVNFALTWRVIRGERGALLADDEFRFYAGILASVTAVLAALLFTGAGLAETPGNVGPIPGQLEDSLRHAAFQGVSIVTTTGYASMDFNTWSAPAQYVLLFVMFLGGSAGSTGGSVKIVRWLVILKGVRRELFTTVHPDAVRPIRLGGRALDETAVRGIYAFTLLYLGLFALGVVVIVLDAARVGMELSVLEAMSAVAATIGNVGPGFGVVGPMNNYRPFSPASKLFMVFLMWIGRLEIISVLVVLTPGYWRS